MPSVSIIGGGITGLAIGAFLKRLAPNTSINLFERSRQVGGRARSTTEKGFTFDWGPNGFLATDTTKPSPILDLVKAVGLSEDLVQATPGSQRRYLFYDGGLRPIPTSLSTFLGSELLTTPGKFRALLEPVFASRFKGEETVYEFLQRHFGTGFANTFADPLVIGHTAGSALKLSLDALFPHIRQLESNHLSLISGFNSQKRHPDRRATLTSFLEGGIQKLIDGLNADLRKEITTDAELIALEKSSSNRIRLRFKEGTEFITDKVVLATPAFVSGKLLKTHLPDAAQLLGSIPYAGVRVFALGYDRIEVPRPMDGFGFLVPRNQGVSALGVLWSSSIFPNRVSKGKVLLNVFTGGTHDPNILSLSTEEALKLVQRDLEITMGITAPPQYTGDIIWPQGIPQYLCGHQQLVKQIEIALTDFPGITLAGDAYHGIGLNSCVQDAHRVATTLASELTPDF